MKKHLRETARQLTMQQDSKPWPGKFHLRSLLFVIGMALVFFAGSVISTVDSLKQDEKTLSGWLYVLDSNNKRKESQILLVDPAQGKIMRKFEAGYAPDMALSPDGTRLYVASTMWTQDRSGRDILQVIDTASGAVLNTVDNPDRRLSTVREYPSDMIFSPDGRWLYVSKVYQTVEGDFFYVATFDTQQGRFLPEKTSLPGCGITLIPPKKQQLCVVCSGTVDVRLLEIAKNGAAAALPSKLSLLSKGALEHGRRVGLGYLSGDGNILTVIMGDGRFFKIDNTSRAITLTGAIDGDARKISGTDDWLADSWIRHQSPTLSADNTKLYMGIGRLGHLHQGVQSFDRVAVVDSQTLKRIAMFRTSQPFYSSILSKDERQLYAISPEQASIMVIDTATQRETRTIYGIGTSPIRAIVAP